MSTRLPPRFTMASSLLPLDRELSDSQRRYSVHLPAISLRTQAPAGATTVWDSNGRHCRNYDRLLNSRRQADEQGLGWGAKASRDGTCMLPR